MEKYSKVYLESTAGRISEIEKEAFMRSLEFALGRPEAGTGIDPLDCCLAACDYQGIARMSKPDAFDGFAFDVAWLLNTMQLAARAHRGRFDKGGDPYLWHVLRVGICLLPDVDAAIVGILHDVCEDSDTSEREILEALDWRRDLHIALRTLTRGEEPYEEYIAACGRVPLATKIKLADLRDNLDQHRLNKVAQRWGKEKAEALGYRYIAAHTQLSLAARTHK